MAGLLDFGIEDPDQKQAANMGLLSLGLRLMSTPGKFGQALGQSGMGAMGDYQQALQQGQAAKMQKLQMQQHQMALQQAQQQQADQDRQRAWLQNLPNPQMQASQQALAGGGGPTQANAAQMPAVDPTQQMMFEGMKAGALPFGTYLQSLQKEDAPIALADGGMLVTKSGRKLVENPKQDALPDVAKLQRYMETLPVGDPRRAAVQAAILKSTTHQPATQVSVNTGQNGFDNEIKLGDKFRGEPIYKAHQEVQSAHNQITAAIKQANPAGDLAAATKLMKILDPGSVVRESELGMAMAATGLEDRLRNYAGNVISGNKLTPQQRVQFQQLANALLAESAKQFNTKRGEYSQMGSDWKLNAPRALGSPAVPGVDSANSGAWSIKLKGQ